MEQAAKILKAAISDSEAEKLVVEILQSRGWNDFSIISKEALLFPNYFFEFDYVKDKNGREHGKAVMDENRNIDLNFGEEIANKLNLLTTKHLGEGEAKPMEKNLNKIEEIAKIHIGAICGIDKQEVVISNIIPFYVPKLLMQIKLDSKIINIAINLFNKKLEGEIPEKEKSTKDIVVESVVELKSPRAWVRNFSELYEVISNYADRHSKAWFLLVFLLVIILIVVIFIL